QPDCHTRLPKDAPAAEEPGLLRQVQLPFRIPLLRIGLDYRDQRRSVQLRLTVPDTWTSLLAQRYALPYLPDPPGKAKVPSARRRHLRRMLRHQAAGGDPVSLGLRVSGKCAPASACRGAATATSRHRTAPAGDERAHRAAISVLSPVSVGRC